MSTNNPGTVSSDPTQRGGWHYVDPACADLSQQVGIEAGLTGTKRVQRSVSETGVCERSLASRIFHVAGMSQAHYMLCEEDVYLICLYGPLVGVVFTGRWCRNGS